MTRRGVADAVLPPNSPFCSPGATTSPLGGHGLSLGCSGTYRKGKYDELLKPLPSICQLLIFSLIFFLALCLSMHSPMATTVMTTNNRPFWGSVLSTLNLQCTYRTRTYSSSTFFSLAPVLPLPTPCLWATTNLFSVSMSSACFFKIPQGRESIQYFSFYDLFHLA